ncbi:MAG: tRNA (guanine-N1)-methyltransferase [Bacteroidota bacterium]
MKHLVFLLLGMALSLAPLSAQQPPVEDSSIEGQFDALKRKSTNYNQNGKRYEVVRLLELNALQKNILDSITLATGTITTLKSTIAENETEISSLNSKLSEATTNLNQLTEEKDSMSFFGTLVAKSTYKLITWSFTLVLLILLALFIYRFRNSNALTKQAKTALVDLEEEYEQHRRRALEREQKISRKLQDEINKNKKTT